MTINCLAIFSRITTFHKVPKHDGRAYLSRGEYYGRVVTRRDSVGLRMAEVYHANAARLPKHTHESAYFCLVLAGSYREQFGTKERYYHPFSFGFCPAAFQHRDEIGHHGGRFFTIELDAQWMKSLEELDARAGATPTPVQDTRAFGPVLQLHGEFCRAHNAGHEVDTLTVESLTSELVIYALGLPVPCERGRPRWLGLVLEYLDAHYADTVRVGPLAACAGVHPVHLARVFRQVHRCSMAEYLTVVRVQHACRLLAEQELTLAQIAMRTGFADQSHFTRAFTTTVGQPPGAFRRTVFPGVPFVQDRRFVTPYVRDCDDILRAVRSRTLDERMGATGTDQPMR